MVAFRMFFGRIAAPLCLLAALSPAFADGEGHVAPQGLPNPAEKLGKNNFDFTAPDGGVPKDLASRVRIEQKVDARLPLNLQFQDEMGKKVTLGQYFGKKPVMITMLQLQCDQLCSAQFQAMTGSFNELQFSAGKEFDVLTVSIDPREGPLIAENAKEEQLKGYNRAGAAKGWHFLTGDEKNVKALAAAVGIKYIWDEGSKQFIHPDGIVMATPDGRVARYFMKLDYNPRDLRFSIIEASKERVGTVIDQIALSCFHYNPQTGKYSFQVMSFLRVAGIATVLGGLLGIALMVMMEKKRGRGGKSPLAPTSQLKQA
ncbi:MAG TPA: SCO family protein [Abditibacterium sp.]